jgi:hypothetical protein
MVANHIIHPHANQGGADVHMCEHFRNLARTFLRTYWHVQSNTENIKPQLAKLPPILGASRRIVCNQEQHKQD